MTGSSITVITTMMPNTPNTIGATAGAMYKMAPTATRKVAI